MGYTDHCYDGRGWGVVVVGGGGSLGFHQLVINGDDVLGFTNDTVLIMPKISKVISYFGHNVC